METCPRCGAPRQPGPECPRCGVVYTKAAARKLVEQVEQAAVENSPVSSEGDDEELTPTESRVYQLALPLTLGVTFLLTASSGLRSFVRVFFSMWLHELGHAMAGWISGYSAFPGPWRTSISDTRSYVVALLFAAGFLRYGQLAYQAERYGRVAIIGVVLIIQAVCTLIASDGTARAFFTFSGDGGALVLSALLMSFVYAKPGTRLHRGGLRWGLLVMGAFAFWDVFRTWLS
ncbi:MAG: hypothetical protein ACT4TC_06475, partial [Myxococcaceae bacterium]